MTLDMQNRLTGVGYVALGAAALVGMAFLAMEIDSRDPLPPQLADRCEPLTPAPLRVNEQLRQSTPVNCPPGYMPIYR